MIIFTVCFTTTNNNSFFTVHKLVEHILSTLMILTYKLTYLFQLQYDTMAYSDKKKKCVHQFDTISKSIRNAWCFKSDTVVCVKRLCWCLPGQPRSKPTHGATLRWCWWPTRWTWRRTDRSPLRMARGWPQNSVSSARMQTHTLCFCFLITYLTRTEEKWKLIWLNFHVKCNVSCVHFIHPVSTLG